MVDLLVASDGGHLEQLGTLRYRLPNRAFVVVTYRYGGPLTGDSVATVLAHHPTTKNLPNALRNLRLAKHVLASHPIDRVISTGAAVAVPFMIRARQLGIPCHYIESATRATGPSLSGRMLQLVPGVHLYRQTGSWGAPRWQQGPCVFDGFSALDKPTSALGRLVVSTGTHHFPFDAMVKAVDRAVPEEAEVLWQLGSTPPPPGLRGRMVDRLPKDELDRTIQQADVVIGHAGVGLALSALSAGKVPVLVPRRRARREHTDDHQVQLARELDRRGLAVVAEVGEISREHLERAASLRVHQEPPPPFTLRD